MACTIQLEQIATVIDTQQAVQPADGQTLAPDIETTERLSSRGTVTSHPTVHLLDADSFNETESIVELQPVDKGFGAWSYVTAAFAMYIVIWGLPQAFLIFQTYLSTGPHARFPNSESIRLLAPGLQDIEEGLIFPFLPSNPKYRRVLVIIGIFIMTLSTLLASYSEKGYQIVLTQGVIFGIGGILLNFVHVSVSLEWFDQNKGQAMGIIWMGWRVGALAFPLVCQWLLQTHGYEQTLRVLIAPMLSLTLTSILLLRGRYHAATVTVQPNRPSVSKIQALKSPSVLYCVLATCPFFLIVNVPKMFITTFAIDLGLTSAEQAFSLVFLVLSDMMGTYLCGHFSNASNHEVMTAFLAFTTALSNALGLGFARTKAGIYLYAAAVGLASGGFSNCLYGYFDNIAAGNGELFTAVHGIFSFFRGAAILSVGPIGARLLRQHPTIDMTNFAISKYQSLVIYSTTLSASSGILIMLRFLIGLRKDARQEKTRVQAEQAQQ